MAVNNCPVEGATTFVRRESAASARASTGTWMRYVDGTCRGAHKVVDQPRNRTSSRLGEDRLGPTSPGLDAPSRQCERRGRRSRALDRRPDRGQRGAGRRESHGSLEGHDAYQSGCTGPTATRSREISPVGRICLTSRLPHDDQVGQVSGGLLLDVVTGVDLNRRRAWDAVQELADQPLVEEPATAPDQLHGHR